MSRRQLLSSASSLGSTIRASSPQCQRPTCIYQQVRTLKYESYEERRRAAKEWAATEGKRYLRPLGRGRTNYLSFGRRGQEEAALQAQEEASIEVEPEDPWANETAIETLKEEYKLSDEQIEGYKQRHPGLTPAVLDTALSENLGEEEINEAIEGERKRRTDEQFNENEASRAEASRLLAQLQGSDSKQQKPQNLRPFPSNPAFQSQPVLSEELREIIYLKVVRDQLSVRTVSTLMGVSMERVGAVVRMKQMERDWVQMGKPLAVPYSRAVLDMLPTTPFIDPTERRNIDKKTGKALPQPYHEPINELLVHPSTTHQTFVSVPESRRFTRADAAKAFHPTLKSADERIPHPELLEIEKFKLKGPSAPALQKFTKEIIEKEKVKLEERAKMEKAKERATTKVYKGKRWDFKFEDISVDSVGKDGRSRAGVGWRYGMPHEDRKRGQVKIPVSVP